MDRSGTAGRRPERYGQYTEMGSRMILKAGPHLDRHSAAGFDPRPGQAFGSRCRTCRVRRGVAARPQRRLRPVNDIVRTHRTGAGLWWRSCAACIDVQPRQRVGDLNAGLLDLDHDRRCGRRYRTVEYPHGLHAVAGVALGPCKRVIVVLPGRLRLLHHLSCAVRRGRQHIGTASPLRPRGLQCGSPPGLPDGGAIADFSSR